LARKAPRGLQGVRVFRARRGLRALSVVQAQQALLGRRDPRELKAPLAQ